MATLGPEVMRTLGVESECSCGGHNVGTTVTLAPQSDRNFGSQSRGYFGLPKYGLLWDAKVTVVPHPALGVDAGEMIVEASLRCAVPRPRSRNSFSYTCTPPA